MPSSFRAERGRDLGDVRRRLTQLEQLVEGPEGLKSAHEGIGALHLKQKALTEHLGFVERMTYSASGIDIPDDSESEAEDDED